jgi:7-carboxy-7-deazaguanine synthase
MYVVKEIFYTLQGEGFHAGRPAVFCRFAGCNLWSGREEDRAKSICSFCDTDFVGTDGTKGGRYTADALVDAIAGEWPGEEGGFVVFTGGEPLLQLDEAILHPLCARGFASAVETNGTIPDVPRGLAWICVSPKFGAPLNLRGGDELKVVYPQPFDFESLGRLDFNVFSIQPMDGPDADENTRKSVAFCLKNPKWRLSLQTHKLLGIR